MQGLLRGRLEESDSPQSYAYRVSYVSSFKRYQGNANYSLIVHLPLCRHDEFAGVIGGIQTKATQEDFRFVFRFIRHLERKRKFSWVGNSSNFYLHKLWGARCRGRKIDRLLNRWFTLIQVIQSVDRLGTTSARNYRAGISVRFPFATTTGCGKN